LFLIACLRYYQWRGQLEIYGFNDKQTLKHGNKQLVQETSRKKWRHNQNHFSKRPHTEKGQQVSKINTECPMLILDTGWPCSLGGLLEK